MAETDARSGTLRELRVTLAVAVVCGLIVSSVAVQLRPLYVANLKAERAARLESILQIMSSTMDGLSADSLETRVVELPSGEYTTAVDPVTFDADKALGDPSLSVPIPAEMDVAGLKRRAKYALVFVARDEGKVSALILPVWGRGYQSTLRGFLALEGDGSTVLALTFYEQGDTPGLGARIQDPAWEALWPGKRAFDDEGELRIGVSRPGARSSGDSAFSVDGISGATRTTVGVNDLLRFWLGDFGFGPYLSRVRAGEA